MQREQRKVQMVHPNYDPIPEIIIIERSDHDRADNFKDSKRYNINDKFHDTILATSTGGIIESETLRQDRIIKTKDCEDIRSDLNIDTVSTNQISERIKQLTDLKETKRIIDLKGYKSKQPTFREIIIVGYISVNKQPWPVCIGFDTNKHWWRLSLDPSSPPSIEYVKRVIVLSTFKELTQFPNKASFRLGRRKLKGS